MISTTKHAEVARVRTAASASVARLGRAAAMSGGVSVQRPVEVAYAEPIRTPRMVLRPLTASDRPEFVRVIGLSRMHLARFCPLHREGESDDNLFDRQLALTRGSLVTGRAWRRAAFDADGKMVGVFNLNDLVTGLECAAEANWWVSADAVRRGYAFEGLGAMLRHALDDPPRGLGLHRVRALISPANLASVRMAVRLGFARRGAGAGMSRVGASGGLLNLGGRAEMHDCFEIFAPVVLPVKGLQGISPRWRGALQAVLATEAANQLRVG